MGLRAYAATLTRGAITRSMALQRWRVRAPTRYAGQVNLLRLSMASCTSTTITKMVLPFLTTRSRQSVEVLVSLVVHFKAFLAAAQRRLHQITVNRGRWAIAAVDGQLHFDLLRTFLRRQRNAQPVGAPPGRLELFVVGPNSAFGTAGTQNCQLRVG